MLDGFEYRTPESLTISQPVAGIGSRGLAAGVDSCILLIIILVLLAGALGLSLISATAAVAGPTLIVVVVVASVVPVLYYVVCEVATGGRSIGKALFGLRVVDLRGVPVGLADSLVRNLVRILDFLPLLYGIGVVTMFAGRQPRRLGDLAAGTVVVHDRGLRRLGREGSPSLRPAVLTRTDPGPPLAGLERCGKFDLDLLQDFLSRPGLTPERRRLLASDLAAALQVRVGLERAEADEGPIDFLERVYLQLQQRFTGS